MKANYTDEYAKFTELKTKKDSEREIIRKDQTMSGDIGGLRELTLHGSKERVQQWDKMIQGLLILINKLIY